MRTKQWMVAGAVLAGLGAACSDDGSGSEGVAVTSRGDSGTTASGADATSPTSVDPSNGDSTEPGNGPQCPPSAGQWLPDELPDGAVGQPYEVVITAENYDEGQNVTPLGVPDGLMTEDADSGFRLFGEPITAGEFVIEIISFTGDGGSCWPPKEYTLVVGPGAGTSTGTDSGTGESGMGSGTSTG